MSSILSVVFQSERQADANSFIAMVSAAYPELNFERIELSDAEASKPTGAVVALLFDNDFSSGEHRSRWLADWNDHRSTTPLLPIALDPPHGRPPDPISGLKSRFVGSDDDEIRRSIGAMMGLALRPGKNKIFVSHRSVDGRVAAEKVFNHLNKSGHCAWLDEGNDVYNDPNLELGANVQAEIEKSLSEANALILIDTPQAPDSAWVRIEVEIAVGKMIPIYPVVLHLPSERTSAGRFRVLQGLHRRICIESSVLDDQLVFPDAHLDEIVENVEEYLMRVYHNRVVQPRELERWLTERKWEYGANDLRPHLKHGKVGKIPDAFSMLTCCSFEDVIFAPRLDAFAKDIQFLTQQKHSFTRNVFLYPGATRPDDDIKHIMTKEVPDLATLNTLLLSYNEAIARIGTMTGGYYA